MKPEKPFHTPLKSQDIPVPSAAISTIEAPVKEKKETAFDLSQMEPWREFAVTLFNDESHSMDQVTLQLMKALDCTAGRAHSITMEAHHKGSALVVITARPRATRIVQILREIDLHVTLRQIN
ncbi:TPA: hypothetical protein DDW35_03320 [Candidatus Sumerlaeota bacterium]|jgi:ATP-dependent Clp protease adaptor protein ClpS|nr:hypothetical protein [Candidatus Sumerlaeota bacterium]